VDSPSLPHRLIETAELSHPLRRAGRAIASSCQRFAGALERAWGATTGALARATRWRPRLARTSRESHCLVVDCEAFVAGRYPWRLPRRRRWEWAWINTLAHGSRTTVEWLATSPPRGGRRAQAASFVAGEVLSFADRCGRDLGWLQREYLVPIELECMRGMVRTSATTTAAVLEALRRARRVAFPLPTEE
jgi:hypothetical protein